MLAVETRALTKRYGAKCAVNRVAMHVGQGEIYGFVGRNGAGKSTVMKMLCGLATPTEGEIALFGGPQVKGASRIGALIESPGLLGSCTAMQNLMTKALALGIVDPKPRCAEALEIVGLGSVANKRAKGFSLGMKQRLGLALALIGSPDLLLLDEPFNGLDPEGTRAIRALLVELNQSQGVTIVISSHVLDQLDRVCTSYGVIRDGSMVREMSAEVVQSECGDSLLVRTAQPARTLAILQDAMAHASFTAQPDGALVITGPYTPAVVAQILHDADQTVLELSVRQRDIEDYFVELMEGGANHV